MSIFIYLDTVVYNEDFFFAQKQKKPCKNSWTVSFFETFFIPSIETDGLSNKVYRKQDDDTTAGNKK